MNPRTAELVAEFAAQISAVPSAKARTRPRQYGDYEEPVGNSNYAKRESDGRLGSRHDGPRKKA